MIYTFLFCKPGIDYRFFAIEIKTRQFAGNIPSCFKA